MKKETAKSWCMNATRLIKFQPDREAVQEELLQHFLDKQEDLRQQGIPEDQIEDASIAAMGSAEEIAPQLAAIHRPFWGYAYRVCCALLVLFLLVATPIFFIDIRSILKKEPWEEPYFYFPSAENGDKALLYTQPNTQVKIGEYTISVTQVLLHESRLFDMGQYTDLYTDLLVQIKVQHPKMYDGSEIFKYIWADDSLGNVYCCSSALGGKRLLCDDMHIVSTYPHRYGFAHYYELTFHDNSLLDFISKDAQWIDLHYDRDGTQFTIRIDLMGGDGK